MAYAAKYVVVFYILLALTQIALSITLIVYGSKGLNLIQDEGSGAGIPYPVGALIVGPVFLVIGLSTLLMVGLWTLDSEGAGYVACVFCVFVYLGLPSFILGMIFTIAFGISNCKTDTSNNFCSYESNIIENYNTAVTSLVIILVLFLSVIVDIIMLCKFGDLQADSGVYSGGTTVGSGSSVGPATSGNPTLKKMQRDRERRLDADRQRRLGVPENRIVRKFFGH